MCHCHDNLAFAPSGFKSKSHFGRFKQKANQGANEAKFRAASPKYLHKLILLSEEKIEFDANLSLFAGVSRPIDAKIDF